MTGPAPTLVCFAVPEEAAPFRRHQPAHTEILVTRMGPAQAERQFLGRLAAGAPDRVFTCGFAGALNPDLPVGTVVFNTDPALGPEFQSMLRRAGAVPASFQCRKRVATTADEKAAIRASTGADVVEMESGVIREICRARGIPAATIRVISDAAGEDLPLDFNELMRPDGRLAFPRLVWQVLRSPGRVPAMIRLGRNTARAAARLAAVLSIACDRERV